MNSNDFYRKYSSLANAVPPYTQSQSAANSHRGGSSGHMYTNNAAQANSTPQAFPNGYEPQYSMTASSTASQYPQTPYTSASAGPYPDAAAHNMQYAGGGHGYGPSTWSGAPVSAPAPYYNTAHGPSPASSGSAPAPAPEKQCYHCGAKSTPLWRRDAATQRTLCNACGLYLTQRRQPRPKELIDADQDDEDEDYGDGPVCSHCQTRQTSVWRRNENGDQVCNACGMYKRVSGMDRPLSLKRNKIKPRARRSQV